MTEGAVQPASTAAPRKGLSLIDCDVHQAMRTSADLVPYLSPFFRERGVQMGGGSGFYTPVGVSRHDARPPGGGNAGSCLETMRRQHLDPFGVDYAILTGSGVLGVGTMPDYDYAADLARAYNDWLIERWLPADPRFFGSLIIAPQDPLQAAKEIRRVGGHPRIVQVLMCSATRIPYGQRCYHPIYEAAEEMGLHMAVHPGTEGRGITNPPTGAGWPSTYLEWHTNLSQNYMAQVTSLVLEGVFEKFPRLKFVCIEGGLAWVPHLMWRMDKNWKGLRSLVPWLKRPPSEYIREHIRLTTQPIEEPERPEHLVQILEMMHADEIVMFSSDYPHWDNDSPTHGFPKLPEPMRRRILYQNAQELYNLPTEPPDLGSVTPLPGA